MVRQSHIDAVVANLRKPGAVLIVRFRARTFWRQETKTAAIMYNGRRTDETGRVTRRIVSISTFHAIDARGLLKRIKHDHNEQGFRSEYILKGDRV